MVQQITLAVSLIAFSLLGWNWVAGFAQGSAANWSAKPPDQMGQPLPRQMIDLGDVVERSIAGEENHQYRLRLAAGEYCKLEVFQYWISVELRLFDPTGKLVVEIKLHNDDAQTEMLSAIADQSGDYLFELKALGHPALSSSYKLTYVKQQMATATERQLLVADRLQLEAYALARQGSWEEALRLSEQGVSEYEKVYGANHQELIEPLKLLEVLFMFRGDVPAKERVSKRCLAIEEAVYGQEHLKTSDGLLHLANSLWLQGKDTQAKIYFERALLMREKLLNPADMRIAQVLSDLGNLCKDLSEFTQASERLQRSMAIAEKTLGPMSYFAIMRCNDLAELAAIQGDYATAVAYWERGVTSAEKYFPRSPVYAAMIMNLGQLHLDMGDYDHAQTLFRHTLPLFEKWWKLDSPNSAKLLALMGKASYAQGALKEAEQLQERALKIREKLLEADSPDMADSINALAKIYSAQRRFDEAALAFQKARKIYDKLYSDQDWRWGAGLRDWGKLYELRGDKAKAEQLIRRALVSYENSLGENHPYTFELHSDLVLLGQAQGHLVEALTEQQHAARVSEFNLSRSLFLGSELQKLRFLEKFGSEVDAALSLHVHFLPRDMQAAHLGFQTLLRRKGRALDEMGQVLRLLRQRTEGDEVKLFDQLSDKLSRLSVLMTRGPEGKTQENYLEQVKQVNEEIEKVQATLSERSREFRTTTQPITWQAVQGALPPHSALVEFARFKAKTESYYAAYILFTDGTLRWVNLGKAELLEQALAAWRNALDPQQKVVTGSASADFRQLARQVDTLVMQPVRAQLGKVRQVFLAPDGELHLLPFAALVDERGRELVRDFHFIYLTSGRDLLRLQIKHQSTDDVLVVAAPDYDGNSEPLEPLPVAAQVNERSKRVSREAATLAPFVALPYARAEAEAVKSQFSQARLLLGPNASESAVKQAPRPRMLHLITHGVYLKNQAIGQSSATLENPLLRSWLALAGANQRKSGLKGEEDGILTAYEAAALDLWGTKLVVLSACQTGVGEVRNGEGVYGLRRALVLAGAETQVTSLWRIDDYVTKNLMKSYYGKLRAGVGRIEALRQVQLEILRNPATRHPYYWAGFIGLGEWANLVGARTSVPNAAPREKRR